MSSVTGTVVPKQAAGYEAGYGAPYAQQAMTPFTTGQAPPPAHVVPEGAVAGVCLYGDDDGCGDYRPHHEAQRGPATASARSKFVVLGYKDVWAAVLFLLATVAVISIGSYNYVHNIDIKQGAADTVAASHNSIVRKVVMWTAGGAASGLPVGVVLLGVFFVAPHASLWIGNLLSVVFFAGLGGFYIYQQIYYPGILLCLVAVLRLFMVVAYRRFIPVSAALLRQATSLTRRFWGTVVFNMLSCAVFVVWVGLLVGAVYPTIRLIWTDTTTDQDGDGSNPYVGRIVGVIFAALFAIYWTSQVVMNTGHVVTSGATATWYFFGGDDGALPPHVTAASAKRALTTSFGSICFGSLLVALLRTLRSLLTSTRSGFLGCCAACILSCIEGLIRLFNHYAFVYCAIYGFDYVDAARRTMDLAQSCGFAAVFNNILTTATIGMFSLVWGVAYGGITFVVYDADPAVQWPEALAVALLAGLMAFASTLQMLRSVDSAITALFVCVAEEPAMLPVSAPEMHAALEAAMLVMTPADHARAQQRV